jgi:RNA polymerase sigma-70 factor (ECF subfamily)
MRRLPAPADPLTRSADTLADDELVEASRAGDERAFERLFDRHWRSVARLAGRFFSGAQRIEELVQEVFTEAFLDIDRYRGGHNQTFAAWLKRITVTTCYDALRRARARGERRFEALGDRDVATLNAQWQGARLDAEQSIILRDLAVKLLARLSPEDRIVLTLLNGEELSVGEIADLTGWSEAKVKVRAHRARKSLRAIVKGFL